MRTAVFVVSCTLGALLLCRPCFAEEATLPATVVKTIAIAPPRPEVTFSGANGNGQFAELAPYFTLNDANGHEHDCYKLYKDHGMVVMLSAATLSQYDHQKKWEKYLKRGGWPAQNAPSCVVIEDVSQSPSNRGKALSCMRDKSREDSRELLLVDENGNVRRAFGVNQDETVILVVDARGYVVHHEIDADEQGEQAAQRVMRHVRTLVEMTKPEVVAAVKTAEK